MNKHPSSACDAERRRWLAVAGTATLGMGMLPASLHAEGKPTKAEDEVAAVEDLMREHGVLRRALLVYAEAGMRLSRGLGEVSAEMLAQTAQLFRRFGEDYHERDLEERHVFPVLIKAGGEHGAQAKTLIAQHARGRQITDYVIEVTRHGRVGTANSPSPDRVIALDDPGDETARRYRFQYTWTAIVCCMLLDETRDVVEIFCEHHEVGEAESLPIFFLKVHAIGFNDSEYRDAELN